MQTQQKETDEEQGKKLNEIEEKVQTVQSSATDGVN